VKNKSSADIFSWLDAFAFHFGGEKSSTDNFSGLDSLVFHVGGEFYSTDNFKFDSTEYIENKDFKEKI
jgi:hypothetical protein